MPNQPLSMLKDLSSRPVVSRQSDFFHSVKVSANMSYVLWFGPSPGEDRLLGVSYHEQILVAVGDKLDSLVLDGISILPLVYHNIAEAVREYLSSLWFGLENLIGLPQNP